MAITEEQLAWWEQNYRGTDPEIVDALIAEVRRLQKAPDQIAEVIAEELDRTENDERAAGLIFALTAIRFHQELGPPLTPPANGTAPSPAWPSAP